MGPLGGLKLETLGVDSQCVEQGVIGRSQMLRERRNCTFSNVWGMA